jgi:hypothetical protein
VLDHVSIRVADYHRSRTCYMAALAPLGYTLAMEVSSGAGFHKAFIPDFRVKQGARVRVGLSDDPSKPGCGGPYNIEAVCHKPE